MHSGETLNVTNNFIVGNHGTGEFTTTGVTMSGGKVIVRNNTDGAGTFQGYGTVGFTGALTNNGKVIADGGGSPQTLSFASMSGVTNTINNPTTSGTNGWFAVNQGKLTLPAITVSTGNPTVYWGDSLPSTGSLNDMVNSIKFVFSGVSASGTLNVFLLASDRSDVMPATGTPVGYWHITSEGLTFTSAEMAFRYDDVLAQTLGYMENNLKIYRYTGGSWVDMTNYVDTENKIVYALATTGFSDWKLDNGYLPPEVPEPATVISMLLGLFGFVAKRFNLKRSFAKQRA